MGVNMRLIKKTIRLFCLLCIIGLFVVLGLYLYAYYSIKKMVFQGLNFIKILEILEQLEK